jgi:membrane-associated HD superfamily phosphohydrolase
MMKHMKAFILTAAIMIGVITSGYSQTRESRQKRTPEERARQMTVALEKKLNFTADQSAKVYDLYRERVKKMDKVHREHADQKKDMMEGRKERIADNDKKLEKILNADQLKTYLELRSNKRENVKKHHLQKNEGKMKKARV